MLADREKRGRSLAARLGSTEPEDKKENTRKTGMKRKK